jgi:hypothetical protein
MFALSVLVVCGSTSCVFVRSAGLGLRLLGAVRTAPEGERLCAAFEVLDAERDGVGVAGLLNVTMDVLGKPVRFTPQEGDALLNVVGALRCESLECIRAQIASLDPPAEDAGIVEWVEFRIDEIRALIQNCPFPLDLQKLEITQLVRLLVALELVEADG